MQQIVIIKTKETELALRLIRKKYALLSDSEILKVLLGFEYLKILKGELDISVIED